MIEENPNPPIMQIMEELYRSKETVRLSLRLAYTMTDLLGAIRNLCEQNAIEFNEGIDSTIEEIERLLAKLKDTEMLPLSELLRRPPTILRQPNKTTFKGTVYTSVHKSI